MLLKAYFNFSLLHLNFTSEWILFSLQSDLHVICLTYINRRYVFAKVVLSRCYICTSVGVCKSLGIIRISEWTVPKMSSKLHSGLNISIINIKKSYLFYFLLIFFYKMKSNACHLKQLLCYALILFFLGICISPIDGKNMM